MPHSWNSGMVEYWFIQGYFPFLILSFRLRRTINPIIQYPKSHFSNVPSFQHSNWGEAPNLMLVQEFLRAITVDGYECQEDTHLTYY